MKKKYLEGSGQSIQVQTNKLDRADTVDIFGSGKVSLEEILAPAAELGERGFPVSELTASFVSHESITI